MASRTSKGNYHKKRTKEWLESQGFTVALLETTFRIFTTDKKTGAPKVIFVKRDVWGADCMARNAERLIFVQVKANAGDISKGLKELSDGPWPPGVERWVAHWPERRRSSEGPDITEVPGARARGERNQGE